ncbi:hypothetical protein JRO89_XS10G0126200 [Xanthoceras sorbifolium]|uniref:Starch synthase, chloroplastic/amyloplastic n=1 Tax=Xanthoceras sorbifolium TaxID=99658 RepID=A0ABQ8HIF3_9ROSI|nr:hypothetical protein JRO89_XS10G0126200 [Xanthoceras sorbifolium]
MATVTASQFAAGSTQVNYYGTSGQAVVTKGSFAQMGLRNQSMTHSGLRSLNIVDRLQMKTSSKAVSRKAEKKDGQNTATGMPLRKIICGHGMNLVFLSSEVGPWSKTGGLGDVVGGLPPAMAAKGHRVMTVSPRYDQYKDAWDTNVVVEIRCFPELPAICRSKLGTELRLFDSSTATNGALIVFSSITQCSSRRFGEKPDPKSMDRGLDWITRTTNFASACCVRQAALEAPRVLNLNSNKYFSGPYGEDVVFVANDWHTALLPCYLKTMYQLRGIYKNAKVAFCIHNIAYQGRFAFTDFSLLNLPDEFKGSFDFIDGSDKPVKGKKINWMKAGILESDRVVTVSPYYAQELISGIEKGVELDNIIRKTGITGIVNGMDVQEWNPATDKYIDVKYDAETVMDAKPLLKEALQAEVGLPVDRNIPLIGFIGRLEEQKGSDILVQAISKFVGENVQIVILGTGKKAMEKPIEELEIIYPDKARGVAKFNVPLAHMIIAGADFMLLPSRFEPCGLIQLHAMRYGTVPIVASTGGLVDTVKESFTGFQMGAFNVECDAVDPADVNAVAKTVKRALATYGTPAIKEMIQNCMAQDLSWKEPARLWEKMLLSLEAAGSEPGIEGEEIAPLAKENVATP